jgi:hypothetical protein
VAEMFLEDRQSLALVDLQNSGTLPTYSVYILSSTIMQLS